MKKSIILIALFSFNLTFAQNFISQTNLKITDNEELNNNNFQYLESFKPSPETDTDFEWDTLFLSFNAECTYIRVIGPGYYFTHWDVTWLTPTLCYIMLINSHEYTLGVTWQNYNLKKNWTVFKQNYSISESDTLEFNSTEAIYTINLNPVDVDGTPFQELYGANQGKIYAMFPWGKGYYPFYVSCSPEWVSYFSELSANIKLQCSSINFDVQINNQAFFVEYPALDGISQNHSLTNQPEDFIKTNLQLTLLNEEDYQMMVGFENGVACNHYSGFLWKFDNGLGLCGIDNTDHWNGEIYLINQENEGFDNIVQLTSETLKEVSIRTIIETAFIENINDSIGSYLSLETPYNVYKTGSNDTLFFGESSSTLSFNWFNSFPNQTSIWAWNGKNSCILNDWVAPRDGLLYQLKDEDGNVIHEIILPVHAYQGLQGEVSELGNYSVEVTNFACPIQNYSGQSKLISSFELGGEDAIPPFINPVQFRNDQNKPTYRINTGAMLALFFSAMDYYLEIDSLAEYPSMIYQAVQDDKTKVFIKEYSSEIWQEVAVEKYYEDSIAGYYYKCDLSEFTNLDSSALDLKISVSDMSSNETECIIKPAILIDGFIITGQTESFLTPDIGLNIFPNPTSSLINCQILSEVRCDLNLNIYDINGKKVLVNKTNLVEGENMLELDLVDSSGSHFEPGIYFCVFHINDRTLTRKIIVE